MAKRVSKAQARRRAAEIRQKQAHPDPLPEAHQRYLDTFTAAMAPREVRSEVLAAVQDVCRRAGHIAGLASFKRITTDVTALATWAAQREIDLDLATLMSHSTIQDFARWRLPRQSEDGRALRARRLMNLASEINPGPDAPPRLIVSGHQPVKPPYDQAEEATIIRVASTQRRREVRKRALLAIGLARGAGASPSDLRHVLGADVSDRAEAGIFVTLGSGEKRRTIPVRRRYEDLVRQGMVGVKPSQPALGTAKNAVNGLLQSLESLTADNRTWDVRRLRTAWIADLMTEPIPLSTLLAAAGLRGPRTIADVYEYLAATRQPSSNLGQATDAVRGGAL